MNAHRYARPPRPLRCIRRVAIGLVALGHALLLLACAAPEIKHGPSPPDIEALRGAIPCCASLAELPYRALEVDREKALFLKIDATAPAFEFATGKSFFAAFRLPEEPRPLEICMTSSRPSRADRMLGLLASQSQPAIFHPAALVLDDRFRVKRIVQDLEGLRWEPEPREIGIGARVDNLSGCLYVDGPPEATAYLVVLSTDELRARRVPFEPFAVIDGFSPVGTVELQARGIPFARLPVRYRGSAVCPEEGGSGLFWKYTDTLLVSENGVHCLAQRVGRYLEQIRIPSSQIVSARLGHDLLEGDQLVLDVAEGATSSIVRRTIAISLPSGVKERFKALEDAITAGLVPGWYREGVFVTAAKTTPLVELASADGAPKDAAGHIAQAAETYGGIAAAPCALCQFGGCTLEMLATCAGLAATGAAVGALVTFGHELFTGGFETSTPPSGPPQQPGDSFVPAVRSASGELRAQAALQECVTRRCPGGRLWVHQGRAAVLSERLTGARFMLETSVDRFVLVAKENKAEAGEENAESAAKVPVQLVVEGSLVFRERSGGREERRSVKWEGPVHTVAEWTRPGAGPLEDALRKGCDGLAAAILSAGEAVWKAKQ